MLAVFGSESGGRGRRFIAIGAKDWSSAPAHQHERQHTDLRSTMIYTAPLPEDVEEALDATWPTSREGVRWKPSAFIPGTPMIIKNQDAVLRSLELLRSWMVRAGPQFWPQEQTLQDWLAAAFVRGDLCTHPTHIVAEAALGEQDVVGVLRPLIQAGTPTSAFLYDLTVLKSSAKGESRSFTSLQDIGIALLVQVKALNSAGTMDRADLRQDIKTLWVAREFERGRGRDLDTLFVILATDCKIDRHGDRADAESRLSWLRDRFDEITGTEAPADIPGGIPVALVLRDQVLLRETTGTWIPSP